MIKEGQKAPAFSVSASSGKTISLIDFSGKYIVLYFYPKDDTPGCSKEACSFRDDFEFFKEQNIVILGVSKDNVENHNLFIKKYQLPFLLLSDVDGKLCELYNVWKEKKLFGKTYMGIERSTFIIDPKMIISKIFQPVKVKDHSKLVISALKTFIK